MMSSQPLTEQRVAQIVRMRMRYRSHKQIMCAVGCGSSAVYRVLRATGLDGPEWYARGKRGARPRVTTRRRPPRRLTRDELEAQRFRTRVLDRTICNRCAMKLAGSVGPLRRLLCDTCVDELCRGEIFTHDELPADLIEMVLDAVYGAGAQVREEVAA